MRLSLLPQGSRPGLYAYRPARRGSGNATGNGNRHPPSLFELWCENSGIRYPVSGIYHSANASYYYMVEYTGLYTVQ